MTRCHICDRPCVHEVEPAVGEQPAILEDEVYEVVLRNRLVFDACLSCWMKWPDVWKRWPAVGYGRSVQGPRKPPSAVELENIIELLGEVA